MRLMKTATEGGGSHQAPVFERTPVLCLGTESVAILAAEPHTFDETLELVRKS